MASIAAQALAAKKSSTKGSSGGSSKKSSGSSSKSSGKGKITDGAGVSNGTTNRPVGNLSTALLFADAKAGRKIQLLTSSLHRKPREISSNI